MADYGGPGNVFLQGFGLGSSSAAQGISNDLRRQQLISEDRLRRQQEANTAQHMALLMDEHNSKIEKEADYAKAGGVFAALTAPTIELPSGVPRDTVNDPGGESSDPTQGTTTTVPNPLRMAPEDAALKAFIPALMKHGDERGVQALLANSALAKYRGQNLDVRQYGIDASTDRNQANIDARINAINQRHQNELETVGQKFQNAQDLLDLKNTQGTKIQEMRDKARLSIAQGEVSREQFLNRHLNSYMLMIQGTKAGAKMDASALKDAALKDLGDAFDLEIAARRNQPPSTPSALTAPLGKVQVISPDGKIGSIPASQLDEAIKAGYRKR